MPEVGEAVDDGCPNLCLGNLSVEGPGEELDAQLLEEIHHVFGQW